MLNYILYNISRSYVVPSIYVVPSVLAPRVFLLGRPVIFFPLKFSLSLFLPLSLFSPVDQLVLIEPPPFSGAVPYLYLLVSTPTEEIRITPRRTR